MDAAHEKATQVSKQLAEKQAMKAGGSGSTVAARESDDPVVDFEESVGECQEIAPGVHFLPGFGNTTIIIGADGVAIVDPGLHSNGPRVVRELRRITELPVRYVIYTHGHFDHAFGTPAILVDAEARGHEAPDIVGHVNVAKRFDRYAKTSGHIAKTFDFQFASWGPNGGDVVRKAKYCYPTIEYDDRLTLDGLGDMPIECRHGLGETDDHTWVWVPSAKAIVGGDFIVSSIPNAGTPFRVQRYVLEWAEALEEMASVEPDFIVSGHGGVFTDDAADMLSTTSKALRYLEDEVVRRINAGQWYEQIVHEVELPPELASNEYLQPLYGCPTFVVHSVLRRYTGWYDGNPSHLFPSTSADIAHEVVELAGGVDAVLVRVDQLAASGTLDDLQLALHLVDFVIDHGKDRVVESHERKADLLKRRSKHETSFVAHNILRSAAQIEREKIDA